MLRVMGKAFDRAGDYFYADRRFLIAAGCVRWFPEFTPTDLIAVRFILTLMKGFFRHDICCHVGGSFPTYLAWLQTRFERFTIFITLKENPLINLILQSVGELRESFYVGRYHFDLYQVLRHMDVCRYVVSLGDQTYSIPFMGVDSIVECGARSNVDFVHFLWRTVVANLGILQHAITILPDPECAVIRSCSSDSTMFHVSGGPSSRAVACVTCSYCRSALSRRVWHRLRLAIVASVHDCLRPFEPWPFTHTSPWRSILSDSG